MSEEDRKSLSEQERQAIRDELAAYAREMAGTEEDLDPALEEAGLESLALYEAWAAAEEQQQIFPPDPKDP